MINSKYQVHILLGLMSGPKSILSSSNDTMWLDNVYKFTEKVTVTEL